MSSAIVEPFERRLARSFSDAIAEGSLYFEGRGEAHRTLRALVAQLKWLGLANAVAVGR